MAEATYRAAVARWPAARITLRQGIASHRILALHMRTFAPLLLVVTLPLWLVLLVLTLAWLLR